MALNDSSLYGHGKELEPSVDADLAQREGSDIQEARPKEVGELAFDEYTSGGLGRHLGVFSTTCLVYVSDFIFTHSIQPGKLKLTIIGLAVLSVPAFSPRHPPSPRNWVV